MAAKIRLETGSDTGSIQSRLARSTVVASMAPNEAAYQNTPQIKDAGTTYIQVAVDLKKVLDIANTAKAAWEAALTAVDARVSAYDIAYRNFVNNVETYAPTAESAHKMGLVLLARASNTLGMPLSIDTRYDYIKSLLRIHVHLPPGMSACRIEISPSPATPGSYKEIDGYGRRVALPGYAPGQYLVRAASVVAGARSDFYGPVTVTVR